MFWQLALQHVLAVAGEGLNRDGIGWAIIGSAASALQGCRLPPGDIDMLFADPKGVHRFAEFMSVYAVPERPPDGELWLSSKEEPFAFSPPDPDREVWNFGRWLVADWKIEAAHIARPANHPCNASDSICETTPRIWPHIRYVSFNAHRVPVVPLEIRLGTELLRERQDRVDEIVSILRTQGHNHEVLAEALSRERFEIARRLLVHRWQ